MVGIALIFPGQGSQYSGMGKKLYDESPAAREVFTRLEAIRPGTMEMCFSGSDEDLKQTRNTQPCLYAVEMAAAASLAIEPTAVAGFSLGEAVALAYAGAYSLEDGFRAVIRRAELMDAEAEKHKSAMVAVLKLDDGSVERIASSIPEVYPVNYNAPGQVVCAVSSASLERFCEAVSLSGGRAMRLSVSGGFHSPFMAEAAESFRKYLEGIGKPDKPRIPVYADKTAAPYADDIIDTFASQIVSPVRWADLIRAMIGAGCREFVEAGPGATLTGLIRRIDSSVSARSIEA